MLPPGTRIRITDGLYSPEFGQPAIQPISSSTDGQSAVDFAVSVGTLDQLWPYQMALVTYTGTVTSLTPRPPPELLNMGAGFAIDQNLVVWNPNPGANPWPAVSMGQRVRLMGVFVVYDASAYRFVPLSPASIEPL